MLEFNYIQSYLNKAYKHHQEDTPQERGKTFEFLIALKLNIYHWDDAAPTIRKQILIKEDWVRDRGIDLVDIENNKVFQVKLYEKSTLGWGNISTFLAYVAYVLTDNYSPILITNTNCKLGKIIINLLDEKKIQLQQYNYQELYQEFLSTYEFIHENIINTEIENRYYQKDCINNIINHPEQKEFKCELACGTGKSYIMLDLIKITLESNNDFKFIIFVNTTDLGNQTLNLFKSNGVNTILVGDNNNYHHDYSVIICIYNSNKKIPNTINFRYLIIDESHHLENKSSTFIQEIKSLKYQQLINFSATFRNKDNIDYSYTLRQGINDNYLSDYRLVFEIFSGENYQKALVNVIKDRLISWSPMFIYFNSTERAKKFNQLLLDSNLKSEFICGQDNSTIRNRVRQDIEEQKLDILCLCGVYNEGISINCLKSVIFGDLRYSQINKIQIAMRASRKHHTKTHYNIIFPVSNTQYEKNQDLKDILNTFTSIDSELKENIKNHPKAYLEMKCHNINEHDEITDSHFCNEEVYDSFNQKILSTIEQKVMELLQWVEINQKTPIKEHKELFSDGSNIGIFWQTIKDDQKIEQTPYDLLKSNPILMCSYQNSQNMRQTKLTPEQKVMKFLQWVETNQKLPTRKPNELFSDGSKISNFWFRIKSDQKIEQPPFDLLKSNPILMLAYQKYQKSKLIIKLTPEQKVMKLLQWVETNQKPPTRSNELFSDGANISSFWDGIKQQQKIEQPPFDRLKSNPILMGAYQQTQKLKQTKLTHKQKVMELLQWVEINQKTPIKDHKELFSDGMNIGLFWGRIKNRQKIEKPPYDLLKSNTILMDAYQESQEIKQTKLSIEQKVMNLLQWVEINQKPPPKISNELFSDGCKIGGFWGKIKERKKIEKPPYDLLKSNTILMDAYKQQ